MVVFWKLGASVVRGWSDRWLTLREKCPFSEFFWSLFSSIWTEYGEIGSISPCSVRMRENTDQKNSGKCSYTFHAVWKVIKAWNHKICVILLRRGRIKILNNPWKGSTKIKQMKGHLTIDMLCKHNNRILLSQ